MKVKEDTLTEILEVVRFYSNPETYHAIGFFPDPPCGEFMDDFGKTDCFGIKPGKRARELFQKLANDEEFMKEYDPK